MTSAHEPPPPTLAGFKVGAFLGGGGSGLVWAVTRISDGARLAAKVLLASADEVQQEITLLQRIDHEHVLRMHDSVLDTSAPYPRLAVITDLAEGGSLREAIEGRGHLTVGELVTVLTPVARALHDLHAMGLVHGDISPQNILLTDAGKPLIADLGVARLAGVPDPEVWGTSGYVAPEVLGGALPEPASDVYAWGAVAWTALVGTPPEPAALRPHLEDVAPSAPQRVRDLVLSCLAHTPDARPEPGELALQLWQCAAAEPAPVAGSSGARTASGPVDPAAGLTQRIREAAVEPEPVEPVAWWQQRTVRVTAVTAGCLGVLSAGYAMAAPSDATSAAQGVVATSEKPSASTRSATSGTPKAIVRKPTALSPERLGTDTVSVIQGLVDGRARAWASGQESELGAVFVKGSAAWDRDRSDLGSAASQSASYEGLRFTVRRATVKDTAGTTVQVDVVVDRSAYRLTSGTGRRQVQASPGERTVLSLEWTSAGWRIVDWR